MRSSANTERLALLGHDLVISLVGNPRDLSPLVAALEQLGFRAGKNSREPDSIICIAERKCDVALMPSEAPVVVWARDPRTGAFTICRGPVRSVVPSTATALVVAATSIVVAAGVSVTTAVVNDPLQDIPISQTQLRWLDFLSQGGTIRALARLEGFSEREMYRRLKSTYHLLGASCRAEALVARARLSIA